MSGFTLTELAIVLFVVSLMLGGMLMPLSAQQDVRARSETEKALNDTRDQLLAYVVVNGQFPCADTDEDGLENRTGSACTNTELEGDIPFATLGSPRSDGFGFRLRYRVSASFATTFTVLTAGDVTIITRGDNPGTSGTNESKFENTLATNVPAVILSVGKNGAGGLRHDGRTRIAAPTVGTDEPLNNDGSKKVSRTTTSAATSCSDTTEGSSFCQFDDQLAWVPTTVIVNRMVAAGRLP
jgi:type II secretory pathway pseudopilin PulG